MKGIQIKRKKGEWCVYYLTRDNKFREDYDYAIDAISRFLELKFKEAKRRIYKRTR